MYDIISSLLYDSEHREIACVAQWAASFVRLAAGLTLVLDGFIEGADFKENAVLEDQPKAFHLGRHACRIPSQVKTATSAY